VTPTLATGLGLSRDWGVVVADVAPGSAAAAAGVRPGDLIDTFDRIPVDSLPALTGALSSTRWAIRSTWESSGGRAHLDHHQCPGGQATHRPARRPGQPGPGLVPRLGILGVEVSDKLRGIIPPLRIGYGVVVAARTVEGGRAGSRSSPATSSTP